jgi:endo-1,4-beta-xylanase
MFAVSASAPDARDQTLRDLAKRSNLHVGTAVDMDAFGADTVYRERIATEFSVVTAENVMKWSVIEPQRGVFNWGPAVKLVAFAKANKQKVRGHTLVWHNQLPGWLASGVADIADAFRPPMTLSRADLTLGRR